MKNNWPTESLESLENHSWGEIPKDESYLVTTCHKLRKKQLANFDSEDLRIMIGQNIGLKYLIPMALDTLNKNILAEGDFYEGDLLSSVLTSDSKYWKNEIGKWSQMCELFRNQIDVINIAATKDETGRNILTAFTKFEEINSNH
ncbi:MAG: hypothetical protein HKP14_06815 [Bacteroidia bacterium]|nr:hypothetical protein [Bacteroidia bacterium]